MTYNVLDNERRKAIAELRKLPEKYKDDGKRSPAGRFNEALGDAIGVEGLPSFAKIRDRLIHLLGGDQPSGIDMLRAMDDGHSRTCPKSDEEMSESAPSVSITDELRECVDTATKMYEDVQWYELDESEEADHTVCHVTEGELMRIADRIDEQFDRICAQHEAVLQETIDSTCEEQERLQERLRTAELGCDANHRLAEANAKWCDELVDLLRDAAADFKNASYVWDYALIVGENITIETERNRLAKERDELQAKLDAIRDTLDV